MCSELQSFFAVGASKIVPTRIDTNNMVTSIVIVVYGLFLGPRKQGAQASHKDMHQYQITQLIIGHTCTCNSRKKNRLAETNAKGIMLLNIYLQNKKFGVRNHENRGHLFKINDVVTYRFVKISNGNITNTLLLFVEKM